MKKTTEDVGFSVLLFICLWSLG